MRTTIGTCEDKVAGALVASGVPDDNAQLTAKAIVLAEVWGVGSHGLSRLPHYLRRLKAGGYRPTAHLRTVSDRGGVVTYDGESGIGHWQMWKAAEESAARAREHGVSVAAVGNSGHCGALGIYTLPALRHGMTAIVLSNGPAVMPAWGGTTPLLSTSPLAVGLPGGEQRVIVDMATSSVARGRIALAANKKEPLPEGWAFDAKGQPTTDAQVALTGMLAPMAGAKGFALALVVEALTGGMVGPRPASEVADMFDRGDDERAQGIAHVVVTIDPAAVDVDGGGPERMRSLFAAVDDTGGRLPGQRRRDPRDIPADEPLEIDDTLATDILGL
jgi:(2R)-3-sulfolactate dehydrogenase (NADP+)